MLLLLLVDEPIATMWSGLARNQPIGQDFFIL
jgi:hypothetical protein